MPYCKECGTEVHSDDVFCPECGVSLEGKGATVKTAPKEPPVPRPKKAEPAVPTPKKEGAAFPTPKKPEPAPPKPKPKVKRLTVGWLLSWIFGIIFILFGFSGLEFGPGGLLMILLASMFLPPVQSFMRNKLHIELSSGMKIILFIILLAGVGMIQNARDEKYRYVDDYGNEWCEPYWDCTEWSECIDGVHFRECWDVNYCGTEKGMPEMKEECYDDYGYYDDYYEGCEPYWECTEWSECENGVRFRDCWDNNFCEDYEDRPEMKEECSYDWRNY